MHTLENGRLGLLKRLKLSSNNKNKFRKIQYIIRNRKNIFLETPFQKGGTFYSVQFIFT